jgi:hypothetical protein
LNTIISSTPGSTPSQPSLSHTNPRRLSAAQVPDSRQPAQRYKFRSSKSSPNPLVPSEHSTTVIVNSIPQHYAQPLPSLQMELSTTTKFPASDSALARQTLSAAHATLTHRVLATCKPALLKPQLSSPPQLNSQFVHQTPTPQPGSSLQGRCTVEGHNHQHVVSKVGASASVGSPP